MKYILQENEIIIFDFDIQKKKKKKKWNIYIYGALPLSHLQENGKLLKFIYIHS